MTLDNLRDWHARRKYLADIPGLSQQCRDGWDAAYFRRLDDNELHPFPATLDAADASFPSGWMWSRLFGFKMWYAARPTDKGLIPHGWEIETPDTGDKIRDLYELSKLAWEQEAA